MTTRISQRPARRTLVLALGQRGLAIATAFQRRLAERSWANACLATVALVNGDSGGSQPTPLVSGGLSVITIDGHPLIAEGAGADQDSLRQQVLTSGQMLSAVLVERLMGISRVQPAQGPWNGALKLSPEVDVVLTCALDEPLAGACLLDAAYLVRHLIYQRLNAAAQMTALLLLPEMEGAHDPQPAVVRCHAVLRELDRVMAPHDGFVTTWGSDLTVEGWGPPFDRGCYLLGTLNAQSLSLASADERNELAAEIMLQLATTGLADLCGGPPSAALSWRAGEKSQSYAGVGLAAWVYPAELLIDHVSRRMAGELLDAWLTPQGGMGEEASPNQRNAGATAAWEEQAAAFGLGSGATPDALSDQALPAGEFDASALWRPLDHRLTLATARTLRAALDQQMAARLEDLAAQRPALDQRAAQIGQRLGEQLARVIAMTLDKPAPGRLPEAEALAAAVKQWLKQAQASNRAAGETRWHALEAVERELDAAGRQLEESIVAGCFPEATWRSLAALLLRPPRLWRMARRLPEVQRLAAAYAALLLRQSFLALEVLKSDLVTAIYDAALEAADRRCAWLAGLSQSAAAAAHLLPVPPAPCGALGFGLEQSVLTPDTTAALYRRARGPLADLLADVASGPDRLSGWPVADPDGEDLAGVYLAYARQRCAGPLRALTIDRLIVDALPDPQARLEALEALAESASPFLAWDETKLHSLEHDVLYSCLVLGLGEGAGSLALADTGELLFAQVAQTGDSQRVTALSMVQGLTLDALVGWGEGENTTANEDSEWSDDGEGTEDSQESDDGEGSDDKLRKRGNDDATQ